MLLSAFVCPGAGQLVQQRWAAGTVFAAGFIVGFCWFMAVALRIIIDFYRMGFDFNHEPTAPNAMAMLPPLLVAGAFYLANLFDVLAAQFRIARMERERDFANPDS
ncbi:MAG: hypothetical protein KAH99_05130 [Verrucomicrobia bacterium]|nr:hypothetical protein [Verrucomicrobiota bacterium]